MKLPEDSLERPTPDEQLAKWLAGESVCPNTDGECCPDFSCCNPELQADPLVRKAFVQGSEGERDHWLLTFLEAAAAKWTSGTGKNVHVTGKGKKE